MNSKIKIAVIGGTGKSGKFLVKKLLEQGFQLKILIRNPDNFKIKDSLVEVVKGDVANYSNVNVLIKDCQAVISTLGLGIPASEPTIFSKATTNVIQAMIEQNVLRYIVTTGLNVDTPLDNKSPKTLYATDWMKQKYPISTANKQSEFDILSNSNVDWTLVRLPLIEQTDETGEIMVSLEDCLGDKISATDLANFLIEQLFADKFVRKSPFIANV
ncbi:MAG: NAD(P)H-binding protein [Bacteroidetes bacterium]|nr:NAD(P)H-binding protein [Bacteroidota bacterium]